MCSCSLKNIWRRWYYLTCCSLILLGCSEVETKWSRRFDALGPGTYRINSVQASKKEIYVAGTYIDHNLNVRCFTANYSNRGQLKWHQAFEAYDYEQTMGVAMLTISTQEELLTARNDIFVLAHAVDEQERQKAILIHYDTLGNLQWHTTVNTSDGSLTSSLLSDQDGNLYVAGWERDKADRQTLYLGKYATDGETQWFTKYYNEEITFDRLRFATMDPAYFVVAGILDKTGSLFYMKYNVAGQSRGLVEYYTEKQIKEFSDVITDPTGNIYLSATVLNQDTGDDFLVIAYDMNDSLLWTREYNGSANGSDVSKAVTLDELLNVYVTGSSEKEKGITNIAIVKYDKAGNLIWARMHDQETAAHPLMIEPRYLRLGAKPHRAFFYLAGTIEDDAQILRCNADGVFSFHAEYGERGTVTIPTALSEHCLALGRYKEEGSEAIVVMTGPSAILGIARWD